MIAESRQSWRRAVEAHSWQMWVEERYPKFAPTTEVESKADEQQSSTTGEEEEQESEPEEEEEDEEMEEEDEDKCQYDGDPLLSPCAIVMAPRWSTSIL